MNLFRSIGLFLLAAIMLISSIGITVNMHVCGGQVQSIALFVKAQTCKEEVVKPCHGVDLHQKRAGCCEEKSLVVKGKVTNAEVVKPIQVSSSFYLIGIIAPVLYSIHAADPAVSAIAYKQYKPPLIERDVTVLVQSFLI